jgi:SAM-dependent methyltransferase
MNQSPDDSHYLHGTSPDEQARLSKLNELINGRSLAEMSLRPGDRVLDVGSGLGQLTRAMARQVGSGNVIGIERSAEQLHEAQRFANEAGEAGLVEFRLGDATDLPLRSDEWGTFDVAHARFVVEHVRDPLAVVRQMVRAVRPGGRIILEDDGHDTLRIWPDSPGLVRLWQNYIRTYDRVGNDPYVGHRLVALLHEAGAVPARNTWLFFGACSGQRDLLPAMVENLIKIIEGVRDLILSFGEFDAATFECTVAGFREWGRRPDAALWYATSWAEGNRGA